MTETLEHHIKRYFQERGKLSKQNIVSSIKKDFPNWSDNTINMYLSKLKREGKINNPYRGIYELKNTLIFQPKISLPLKKLYNRIKKEYPYVEFCVWDSTWLNDLMRHQPFKQYTMVEVDKEAAESIFAYLSGSFKNAFLNPNEEIFDRYVNNADNVLIVKNLISEAPLQEVQEVVIPTLEKLLVDMLIDDELFAAQQGELAFIMKSAMNKYGLSASKMRRYALRRNRETELNELINISSAK